MLKQIITQVNIYFVIFINNSGGHAASNAQRFVDRLGLKYSGLAPRQLGLFDG
ncbi:hypothetical protein [Bacillus alkalicola]|uniref:Uncharacterized protein n=1 Tax=Evansella alkalicola TaxID=745819 RepID=A0ABS6JU95_9BACI|nr:hypothetical protein [Bacillus alkalicola]